MGLDPDPPLTASRRAAPAAMRVFAVMWAMAAAFHVFGNPRISPAWGLGVLGATILLTLWRPQSVLGLSTLSAAVVLVMWLEAPLLGNHWLLAALVSVAWLLALVIGLGRERRVDAAATWERFVPAARWTLLVFYSFAAFAKLNSDFFDPVVSCAVFYFRQSVGSFGAESLAADLPGAVERVVIVATASIELLIPLLLLVRRTRHIGVLVGLLFHFVLALDRDQHFYDFSSVLFALFVLFLPAAFSEDVLASAGRWRARLQSRWDSGPELAAIFALGVTAALLALAAGPSSWPKNRVLVEAGLDLWLVYAAAVIAPAVGFLRAGRGTGRVGLRIGSVALALVPLVAVVNGLTPYLELKTAYGWNMYSNLRTVDGDSNHFLVRASLPIGGEQDGLVTIVEADDDGLRYYAENDYALTWSRFADYVARHPDVRVSYERGGVAIVIEPGAASAELERLSDVERRLRLFRAVDTSGAERCLTSFGPAR